ncbi:3-oxo-tetronate kinase [Kiloniella majae]|uniref:3-oxo-tetronate kinase n=1 Tax=Kiloniella majae TaxID=1938558 RepID=UPI000A279533|nr:3-oxo-tetronate kinase [Kiloniella majae]
MSIILGCIADDLTGATDLAMILVREGMKTVQVVGEPNTDTPAPDAEAVVVALKSRTNDAQEAISMTINSCKWLQSLGAKQIFFKYCSTFDSTDKGNIGPVTDALMSHLECSSTIACPAFPENKRTVYQGYLFVNDGLLSESSLRNHPLTPMKDANLKRILSSQSSATISNLYFEQIEMGHEVISQAIAGKETGPRTIHITDALNDNHLRSIGKACKDMKLVTGGSAVAQGLPLNFEEQGFLSSRKEEQPFSTPKGPSVILSGSCSEATRGQVNYAQNHIPSYCLDAVAILNNEAVAEEAVQWATDYITAGTPVLLYSSADPSVVKQIQSNQNQVNVGSRVEAVIGKIAQKLHALGASRFVVAGGETSGAVINALNVKTMSIGPQIDPGVPWTTTIVDKKPIALALKSGNFGTEDFFIKALNQLKQYDIS